MDEIEFQGPQGVDPEIWIGYTSGEWACLDSRRAESSLVRGGRAVTLRRVYAIRLARGDEGREAFGCAQCGQVFGLMGSARYHLRRCVLSPEVAATPRRRTPRARYFSEDFDSLAAGELRELHGAYLVLRAENEELRGLLDESTRATKSLIRGVDAIRNKLQGT